MMAEIRLSDLLAWETRLQLWRPVATQERADVAAPLAGVGDERDLTWAVSTRASMPMLPPLRGGELILLSHRVARESGVSIGALLQQIAAHGASGLIVDEEIALSLAPRDSAPVPILILSDIEISSEFETDINRMLTERRGEMYRVGMEIGRSLAALSTSGTDLQSVLQAVSQLLSVPITLVDIHGHDLVEASPGAGSEQARSATNVSAARFGAERLVEIALASSMSLRVGPVAAERHALIRMIGERIAEAIETTFSRSASLRPSGAHRSTALAELLIPPPTRDVSDRMMQATALGLSAAAIYRVALVAPEASPAATSRWLATLGRVLDAGAIDGAAAKIVELHRLESPGSVHGAAIAAKPRPGQTSTASTTTQLDAGWIAISSVVNGVVELNAAARQARYIAALVRHELVRGAVVRFDVLGDLGAYRLLYQLWGTPELHRFTTEALGDLDRRDKRGLLRKSLLAFLGTGGSHVEAAARLQIHRNTLAYRLRQISEVTGQDATDPERRLMLHLALLAQTLPPVPGDS